MTKISFTDLGLMDYEKTLDIQTNHFELIKKIKIENRNSDGQKPTPNFFFFVTHPHTYTMGKNGNLSNILFSDEELKKRNINFFHTNRGGDSTYHGPGQIVGYPIIDLENFQADIHLYVRDLEEVIIKTIADYGLIGERSEGETGVWLDVGKPSARKICAIGVHTSRWVTMHGFALNVNTELSYFDGIIPCGILNKGVTSLSNELQKEIDETEVKNKIVNYFSQIFKCTFTV
jgi:lipoyl(octanoyl) transferase